MTKRYEPCSNYESGENIRESSGGNFVHFSDYEKLVFGLQKIRRYWPGSEQAEVAEAALLSAGEEI